MTNLASCCSPRAFHIWPEERIAAGIDASMITSLGTCRFVIPRVGVDHRERRTALIRGVDRAPHRGALIVGERLDRLQQRSQAVVWVDPRRFQLLAVLLEQVCEVHAHDVPEDDRVRDAHHRRLQMHGEEDAPLFGVRELLR